MGVGSVECDVTFTKDKERVCRHAQNDLHTTTNMPATAECRTSDFTLAKFKTLRKSPVVPMPFDGFSQAHFAQKLIDELKAAKVPPRNVFAQSFNKADVLYWVKNEPAFGRQAVYLDDANTVEDLPDLNELKSHKVDGRQP